MIGRLLPCWNQVSLLSTVIARFVFRNTGLAASIVLLGLTAHADAQTLQAQYSGVVSIVGSGFGTPTAAAVDASGNVYVADATNHAVYKIVAANGQVSASSQVVPVGSGFSAPAGVAVDAAGNVFVADAGDGSAKKIVAVNGQVSASSTVIALANGYGFGSPAGIAVYASGDVFVTSGNGNVYKIGAPTGIVNLIGSGFNSPAGIVVDASGNLFVADSATNRVWELSGATYTPTQIATGFSFSSPNGLAIDAGGNLFVSDSGRNAVEEILADHTTVTTVASGFNNPKGIAVNADGNFILADTGHNNVKLITHGAAGFGAISVGGASDAIQVSFNFSSSGRLSGWSVLTQGVAGKDFSEATGTTCSSTTDYAAGDTCVVAVKFSPLYPGLRMGVVQLKDDSGNVAATAPLKGIGNGPQIVFPSNSASIDLGNGFPFISPNGVAVDPSGNVFVTDSGNLAVYEIAAENGRIPASPTITPVGTGFAYIFPFGIAVDASGNVLVADSGDGSGNGGVYKIVAVNGQVSGTSPVISVGSGFFSPTGIAIDGDGNVFVADSGNMTVYEIVAVGGQVSASSAVMQVGNGFSIPYGVAVDAYGNLFVADAGDSTVKEVLAVNGKVSDTSTVISAGSGFSGPIAVAVDASGDVFVADANNGVVNEIVAVNGQVSDASTVVQVGESFSGPYGVTVDAAGDVYVGDSGNSATYEMALATPPSHNFPTITIAGTTDNNDGTFSIIVANNGNAALIFPQAATGNNPSVSADFAWEGSSTCTQTGSDSSTAAKLTPGESCTIDIGFAPKTGGSISGGVVLTDDSLNAASPDYATQSIALSGLAFGMEPADTTLPIGIVNTPYHQTFTATGGTEPYTYSTSSTLPLGMTFSSDGTLAGTPVAGALGDYTISITVTDSSSSPFSMSKGYTLKIALSAPVISTTNLADATYGAFYSQGVSASGTGIHFAVTGLPSGLGIDSSTGVISGVPVETGQFSVTVTVTDSISRTASQTYTLNVNKATPTITWTTPAAINYGIALSATQLNATVSVGGNCTYTPAAGTVLSAGQQTLNASCTPTDTTNYATPQAATVTLTVNKVALIVTANNQSIRYGAQIPTLTGTLTGVVNNDNITASYTTAATSSSQVGSYPITATLNDPAGRVANYIVTNTPGTLTINKATPTITWATPAAIPYGTALSATQLNATASVPGTFAYSPNAGSVPALGDNTLTAVFTPTDTVDYTTATASVILTVNVATNPTPVLSSLSPGFTTAGDPTFTLTVAGTGFVSGATLYWGSTALTTTYVSSNKLTAVVPSSLFSVAGIDTIFADNPTPGGGKSNSMEFAVDTSPPSSPDAPTIFNPAATVTAGGTATYAVKVPPIVTSISGRCLNLPAGITCDYSQSSGTVSITTSPSTPAGTYQIVVFFTEAVNSTASILLPILLLPLMFVRWKLKARGKWLTGCIVLVVLSGAMLISGCGGSLKQTSTTQGLHSINVTLVVK